MRDVEKLYKKSKELNKPSFLLKNFFEMNLDVDLKDKVAIDLGAGVGNDARFLVDKGFKVTCVDKEELSKKEVINNIGKSKYLDFIIQDFENVKLHKADLIYAIFSLHFCNPEKFDILMEKIVKNIMPGGFFVRKFSRRRG